MNKGKNILFTVCALLALASILSCSSNGGNGGEAVYSYCIPEEDQICFDGPFTASTCNGHLSNSCPFKSSSSSADGEVSSSSKPPSSSSTEPHPLSSSSGEHASSSSDGSSSSVAVDNGACPNAAIENGSVTCGGHTYETVQIGTQVWMKKNLNYAASGSKCGNGSALSDANTTTCDNYGRLYDWVTAMNIAATYSTNSYKASAKHQGICPQGWHIPSNAEWDQLYRFADGNTDTSSPYDSHSAGKILKAQTGWNSDGNGLDTHGFSALPGGYGSGTSFIDAGLFGNWWSSSEDDADVAYTRRMRHLSEHAIWDHYDKTILFSVRCIQN